MRIKEQQSGYVMWLSANETYAWAHRPGNAWPCSTLAGCRLMVAVDSNGLCDLTINGRSGDCDGTELGAIVGDHLPAALRRYWPTWADSEQADEGGYSGDGPQRQNLSCFL